MYNKHNLAVAKIASKTSIKPELASVLFTKDKTVATDSFRLIEMSTPTGKDTDIDEFPSFGRDIAELPEGASVMVKATALSNIKLPKNQKLPIVEHLVVHEVEDDHVELITTTKDVDSMNGVRVRKTAGEYPDYEKVVPQSEPKAVVTFRAEYVADVVKILGALNKWDKVRMEVRGEREPIMFYAETDDAGQKGMGIVMPINK